MPNLCVSVTFNPPAISIIGSAVREETVKRMEQRIPNSTTTATAPSKEPIKFYFHTNPDHWHMELSQHFCNTLHKANTFLAVTECLEAEGWNLRASCAIRNEDSGKETNKLFFNRKP